MKRSDLKVGDELFYAMPGDWRDHRVPHNARMRVAAVEPHERSYSRRYIRPATKGNGVLVDVLNADGTNARYQDVVQLGHLRGPYAATLAEVEAAAKVARKQREADWKRADEAKEKVEQVVKRARDAGAASAYRSSTGNVTLRATDLDALLERLNRAEAMIADVQAVSGQ